MKKIVKPTKNIKPLDIVEFIITALVIFFLFVKIFRFLISFSCVKKIKIQLKKLKFIHIFINQQNKQLYIEFFLAVNLLKSSYRNLKIYANIINSKF